MLCNRRDAALGPIREMGNQLHSARQEDIRKVCMEHFRVALNNIRPSTSPDTLQVFDAWARDYGTN